MDTHSVSRRLVLCFAMVAAAGLAVSAYPVVFPAGLAISKPGVQPGYVIFAAQDGNSYAIDVQGRVAKRWPNPMPNTRLGYTRPLVNGNLLSRVESLPTSEGEPRVTTVIEATQEGRIVWQYTDQERALHHDMERLPNGNTVLVCSKDLNLPQISRRLLRDECLIEVDQSGNVVWEWQTADHLDDLELPQDVKDQIMNGYPGGRRTGVGGAPAPTAGFDYLHVNGASPIPDTAGHTDPRFKPGNIIVSYRYINTLAVVDRDTKKIVWKSVGLTIGQHNPRFIPGDLPGTGHVLVFDNGFVNGRTNPYRHSPREYSRILEIDPLDTSIAWEYTAEDSNRPVWSFFSHYISGAQRLSNGNTLICEGSNGRIFEVTPSGEIVWEYVNPFPNMEGAVPNATVFRAAKVAENWLRH